MKKTAVIWRESIYKNGFRCNVCGAKLFKPQKMKFTKNVYFFGNEVGCTECGNYAAHMQDADIPEHMTGLQGFWNGSIE